MVENESRNYHQFSHFDAKHPQKYVFEGNQYVNLLSSLLTILLLSYIIILNKKVNCSLRIFTYTISIPILLNLFPRLIRSLYILLFRYPGLYSLLWLATIERTLHIATHLIIVISIFVYSYHFYSSISKPNYKCKCILYIYVFISLFSFTTAILFFNFNISLHYIPMRIYFISIWSCTITTIFIICITIPREWRKFSNNEQKTEEFEELAKIRRGWVTVVTFGSIPVIYLTVGTIIDATYELQDRADSINIIFLGFNEFRMLAYYLQPAVFIASLLVLMPQYLSQIKRQRRKNTITDVEKTINNKSDGSNSPRIQISLLTLSQPINKFPKDKQIMAPIEKVKAGGLDRLNPVLYPGATPTATNVTVIRGALQRLDPDVYPGAADREAPLSTPAPEVTVINAPSVTETE